MSSSQPQPSLKNPTIAELRSMPAAERDRILEEQAAVAELEYRTNLDLTDFEAFDEEPRNVESPAPLAG